MKNPVSIVTSNNVVGPVLKKVGKFYLEHQSLILTGGTIGFSLATTAVTFKNARYILNSLDAAKEALENAESKEEKEQIYKDVLKDLAPKIIPIIIFQTATIICSVQNKRLVDKKDKQLMEAASALALAQNAIAQYQAFNEKAEDQLGEKKTAKIRSEIAQERLEQQPMNANNTVNAPMANEDYIYHDVFANRYFHSQKSPSEIENFCTNLSKDLYDGNCDDDKATVNDIYNYISRDLSVTSGNSFGWIASDICGRSVSDFIKVCITPAEMDDHKTLCYELDIMARPLFRTRY